MTIKSHIDHEPDEDLVYRALASGARRRILDIVRDEGGISLGELSARFEISRFAIRKHLQVLLEANLVTVVQEGTSKRHYLNPIPVQFIYDRWLSRHSTRWASALTGLKYTMETEEPMSTPQHRYEVYIRAAVTDVWKAITDPDFTSKYFYGTRVESDFKAGSSIAYRYQDGSGKTAITGEIQESSPPNRLVHSFDFGNGDSPSRVTYELEDLGTVTKLTLVHDQFEGETTTYHGVGSGWNPILSGLKTLMETGEALQIPMPQEH